MAKAEAGGKKPGRPKASASTPPPSSPPGGAATSGAMLGFETKLWQAADKLRNNTDAAEYKHVVLGLSGGCRRVPCREPLLCTSPSSADAQRRSPTPEMPRLPMVLLALALASCVPFGVLETPAPPEPGSLYVVP